MHYCYIENFNILVTWNKRFKAAFFYGAGRVITYIVIRSGVSWASFS